MINIDKLKAVVAKHQCKQAASPARVSQRDDKHCAHPTPRGAASDVSQSVTGVNIKTAHKQLVHGDMTEASYRLTLLVQLRNHYNKHKENVE